ncbi:flagellar biosynthetic protein FliO [Duganella sp. FT92W]|uniref:Flagellar protein n=2 Tax=Pseudoduganella rivuli TaxID=2666085 RepID=A0A7X2IJZ5_9BURK|nr:flagellar biosynthetic protein FliO [Pseudoduganella rivuli]
MAAQTASGAISGASAATAEPAASAGAEAAPAAVQATPPVTPAATPEQQAALAGARPATPLPMQAPPSPGGSLLQTTLSLIVVLAVLVGLAWLLKRYGPKSVTGSANVKLVGALSVGTRERILVVEVGEQWIVVGASPGRMNALATMPRQEAELAPPAPGAGSGQALPSANFAEWFKQTIEKRNGK